MSVGVGVLGRDIIFRLSGNPIAGVDTKSMTVNNQPVEVTGDSSLGWREILATPGLRSIDMTLSGVTKDLSMFRSQWENTNSQLYGCELEYPDGSKLTADFFVASYAPTGEHSGAETFEISLQSSGAPTYTAAP